MGNILEQPLPKNGACNLGSINLGAYVTNPYKKICSFDFDKFKKDVATAIRGLDEVLDEGMELHALPEQRGMARNYRNVGLGIMGTGDLFFKMRCKYGSEDSKKLLNQIMKTMFKTAVIASNSLAREKGAFPKYSSNIFKSRIIENHFTKEEIESLRVDGLRNCSLLSIAPSGSIGTMINCTTGIEPAFQISYNRKTESLHKGEAVDYKIYIDSAKEYIDTFGGELPNYFVSSSEINWKDRVEIQSVAQAHIDTAISSTVNLPNETTLEEVEQLYLYAWKHKLKGITIYRDGCGRSAILTKENKFVDTAEEEQIKELRRGEWADLPEDIVYHKRKLKTGCGKLNVFIGYAESDKKIHDLYAVRSGNGGCEKSVQTTIIAMAGMLRLGGNIFNIEKAFNGTGGCSSFLLKRAKGEELSKGSSCGTAVLYEIKSFLEERGKDTSTKTCTVSIPDHEKVSKTVFAENEKDFLKSYGELSYIKTYNKCPLCNEKLIHTDGCISCPICSYSKCD